MPFNFISLVEARNKSKYRRILIGYAIASTRIVRKLTLQYI